MDFHNFSSIYVHQVKKSIAGVPIELPCLSDLDNSSQLPVQEVVEGTDDCVSWSFTISSVNMFLRSNIPLSTFLLSCDEFCDFENPTELPVQEVLEGTDDFVLSISTVSPAFLF